MNEKVHLQSLSYINLNCMCAKHLLELWLMVVHMSLTVAYLVLLVYTLFKWV